MFLLAEPTDLFRKVTCYIVMVVQVVMTGKGLQNNTESKTIQASHGMTYAARVVYPVFCLMAGGKVLAEFPPSVVEEVLDSPLVKICSHLGPPVPGADCSRTGGPKGSSMPSHLSWF